MKTAVFQIHGKETSAKDYFAHIEKEHVEHGLPARPMDPLPMGYPIRVKRKKVYVSYAEYLDYEARKPAPESADLDQIKAYYKLLGDTLEGRPVLMTQKAREILRRGRSASA